MSKLRLYTFCNFYLSSIQQGIQTAHIVSELFADYRGREGAKYDAANNTIWEWANNHKTIIVCNGGTCQEIIDACDMIGRLNVKTKYPSAAFAEEPGAIDSIGSAVTGFGIILPEEVYDASMVESTSLLKEWRHYPIGSNETYWKYNTPEADILGYIKSRPLAR